MSERQPRYLDDFFSDQVIEDPYHHYAQMRALGPVIWLEKNHCWAAVSHKSCLDVLRNSRRFLSGKGLSLNDDVNKMLIGSTLNTDGDRHRLQRSITATAIMPDALAEVAPFITSAAETLADQRCAKGRFEAVREFATILPVSIVIELVGLPDEGKEKMLEWAGATFNLFDGFNERSQASFEKLADLQAFLATHGNAEALQEGGLTKRIFEQAPKKGFTREQSAQLMRDYINPSLDTTISAASFLAYYFATNPDQWEMVRADDQLVENAVEEVVRLTTPIRALSRYVAEDCTLHGASLRRGDRILAVYASANRDEQVFERADAFDVTRKTHKHLGFGQGVHMCMGMHLARLELAALVRAMAKNVKSWHLDGACRVAMNNTIRGFESLPIKIET